MKRTPIYNFAKVVVPPIFKVVIPYKLKNKEKMPDTGRVIICSNHITMKDPVLLALAFKRQVYYMAKSELFKNKFVSFIIRGLGAFPVVRGAGDTAAMDSAKNLLESEKVLGIFIEGTRSKDGSFGKPHSGAVLLAHQNNAPILPMCITAKEGKSPRLFHKVVISCGDLIMPEELGIEAGSGSEYRKASRLVMDKIAELRERDMKDFS
ncbi:MAG TPA: lysophospholipid acyltransferase family protein [Oscillospiraceae bacterium]|nr:lysophospholipid acyltransferase family protein [Oscillospiraceae bacterium]